MNITDGEYALALRNADNVDQANRDLASAEADVTRLRAKLARAYADLAISQAHAIGLQAQVDMLCEGIPDGMGARSHIGRKWASGAPATRLSLTYIEAFDRTISGNVLKMNPLDCRHKLEGE